MWKKEKNFLTDFWIICYDRCSENCVCKVATISSRNKWKNTVFNCFERVCDEVWSGFYGDESKKKLEKSAQNICLIRVSGRERERQVIFASPSTQCFWAVHSHQNGSIHTISHRIFYKITTRHFYYNHFSQENLNRMLWLVHRAGKYLPKRYIWSPKHLLHSAF